MNEAFDFQKMMEELIRTVQQTALSTQTTSQQMGMVTTTLENHEVEIRKTNENLNSFKDDQRIRWEKMEEKERIDASQRNELRICIENRVGDLFKQNGFSEEDFKKYYGAFMRKAWNDAKRYSHMLGNGGVDTQQKYFNDVKEYIGTWTPHGYGVMGYKEHLDSPKAQ